MKNLTRNMLIMTDATRFDWQGRNNMPTVIRLWCWPNSAPEAGCKRCRCKCHLTEWFLHSIPVGHWHCWAQTGSVSPSLWRVGPGSGHSTAPLTWTTDLQTHSETSAISSKPDGNDVTLWENIWPLLKVALSWRSSRRLTLWGTEFIPTERWSMGACERETCNSKIRSTQHAGLVICFRKTLPFCLVAAKGSDKHWIFLTRGLDAQALRLRTMAGWVLNSVSSIRPLIMSRSATPSQPWQDRLTHYSLMINQVIFPYCF